MSNHLRGQTSPYLLQHADNPVDWYPWGREALQKAKIEDKPIFLSIGYSTCHWCHVMARESFEDLEIARLLNESFVSIKVDREERPDIDSLYMAACQAFTGSGGWPTTLFLTPEQLPFFAGTYFPPTSRGGLTGLRQLLSAIRDAWAQDREALTAPGRQFLQLLTQRPPEQSSPTRSLLEEGVADGSIHTRRPRELAQVSILLLNVWIGLFPGSRDEFLAKFQFLKELTDGMGAPIFNEELMAAAQTYYDHFSNLLDPA